jgi:hypothetical protein
MARDVAWIDSGALYSAIGFAASNPGRSRRASARSDAIPLRCVSSSLSAHVIPPPSASLSGCPSALFPPGLTECLPTNVSTRSEGDPMPESVRARARHAIVIYSGLTFLGAAALAAAGATPFDGRPWRSRSASAARILTERGHELVIIDADREKLDALGEGLDIGLLHGDGTRPELLRDADPGGRPRALGRHQGRRSRLRLRRPCRRRGERRRTGSSRAGASHSPLPRRTVLAGGARYQGRGRRRSGGDLRRQESEGSTQALGPSRRSPRRQRAREKSPASLTPARHSGSPSYGSSF